MSDALQYLLAAVKNNKLLQQQNALHREHMDNISRALKELSVDQTGEDVKRHVAEKKIAIEQKQKQLIALQQLILAKLSEDRDLVTGDPTQYVPMAATLNTILDKLCFVTELCADKRASGVSISDAMEIAEDSNVIVDKLVEAQIMTETDEEKQYRYQMILEMQQAYLRNMLKRAEGIATNQEEEEIIEHVNLEM